MDPVSPRVSAIVIAYGAEPWLPRCVEALLQSRDVDVDVVVVDNGCTDDGIQTVSRLARVKVVEPGRNLGYAAGNDLGAEQATGDYLALINADAIVEPPALSALVEAVADPAVGIATASLRLADSPELMNSAGNEIHFLGFGWAGRFGEPATDHTERRAVASSSGAAMVIRTSLWKELGGFEPEYFAYHEDAEISWRCWQKGLSVEYVPQAVVVHRYEFSRNPLKMYLLERNRLIFVLTTFQAKTLFILTPCLLVLELAMLAVALLQGWGPHKVRGWLWTLRRIRWLRAKRRLVQSERRRSDGEIIHLLSSRFDPSNVPLPKLLRPFDSLLSLYWRTARKLV